MIGPQTVLVFAKVAIPAANQGWIWHLETVAELAEMPWLDGTLVHLVKSGVALRSSAEVEQGAAVKLKTSQHSAGRSGIVEPLLSTTVAAGAYRQIIGPHAQSEQLLRDGNRALGPQLFPDLTRQLTDMAAGLSRHISSSA